MIFHRQLVPILGPLLIVACSQGPVSDGSTPPREIVEEILREAGFRQVLFLDRTITIPSRDSDALLTAPWADSAARSHVESALADMRTRSQEHWLLEDSVIRQLGARSVSRSPGSASFKGPEGPTLLSLSAVGFSADSTVAAVYWQYHCGGRCGGATVSLFTRSRGAAWRPWRSQVMWMS